MDMGVATDLLTRQVRLGDHQPFKLWVLSGPVGLLHTVDPWKEHGIVSIHQSALNIDVLGVGFQPF